MDEMRIRRPKGQKTKKILGRGLGSGHGKTAGRGTKGQGSRAGGSLRPGFEGGQMPLHMRLPKRGFNNKKFAKDYAEVNLGLIQKAIDAGKLDASATVTVEALVKAGVLRRAKDGVRLIRGGGDLKAKVAFDIAGASAPAVAEVEKAGGSVKLPEKAAAE